MGDDVPLLVPARMLNEFAYCPRLAYLEWVEGDFADNADTVEGRARHRAVDRPTGALPDPETLAAQNDSGERLHARSVYLSAPRAGLVAKIDLVEADGDTVTPIDYKRGEAPDVPEGAWEPERVQLCAQGMILEENGYRCERGILYYCASRRRVEVPFDAILRRRTEELLGAMRKMAAERTAPPPLVDSPKCPRCSLVGICLPDEVNYLRAPTSDAEPRRLLPARDDALPLYVQSSGARIGKRDEELVIEHRDGTRHTVRLTQTSHVSVFGAVQITTQALQAIVGRGLPICYFSHGGWFYAITTGMTHKNVNLRLFQFEAARDPVRSLALARRIVSAKVRNCRTLLRRNGENVPEADLNELRRIATEAENADNPESLLGIEGNAARIYYQHFARMLRPVGGESGLDFEFEGRSRRPPRDRVNALLSLAYAVLTKDVTLALLTVGFDPFLGFYHRPRYGRPALALDVMEEFRPLIADSVVLSAVNTGMIKPGDFIVRGGGVSLTQTGRKQFLFAYERRMDELVTHPLFGYRVSYRRILEVQARLLARHLAGEIPDYPPFLTR